jgi:hypothetical protein
MIDLIREIIDAKGHLPVAARTLDPNANLYEAGAFAFRRDTGDARVGGRPRCRIPQADAASTELLVAQFDRRLPVARGTQSGVIAEHGVDTDMFDAAPLDRNIRWILVKNFPGADENPCCSHEFDFASICALGAKKRNQVERVA